MTDATIDDDMIGDFSQAGVSSLSVLRIYLQEGSKY